MALVNSFSVPCHTKGAAGLTVEIHSDNMIRFTDPESGTVKAFSLLDGNLIRKFFLAIRDTGIPRLSGITFS